jgi:hypothetical protein
MMFLRALLWGSARSWWSGVSWSSHESGSISSPSFSWVCPWPSCQNPSYLKMAAKGHTNTIRNGLRES